MIQERPRVAQKTIPDDGRHGKIDVRHLPDIPNVPTVVLGKLSTQLLPGQKPPASINGNFEIRTVNRDGGHGREVTVVRLSPKTKESLTPLFTRNNLGGGTVGGGGTSKEALRRAKKKAKNSPRK